MNRVFADTSFYLAAVNPDDRFHSQALALLDLDRPVVTTDFVLMELGNTLCYGNARRIFGSLLTDLRRQPRLVTVPATRPLVEKAIAYFMQRPDKDWSMTDCASFVVMTEMSIKDALTADHHFEQAGFRILLR